MKYIFVSGCQRCGTRFYANYLANLYNFKFIDEGKYNIQDYNKLKGLLNENSVIHCPSLKGKIKEIKKDFPESIIIWMYRNPQECINSMKKIDWGTSADDELDKLSKEFDFVKISGKEFEKVIEYSLELGLKYFKEELVDQLINMKSIEHLKGFKKNQYVRKLI